MSVVNDQKQISIALFICIFFSDTKQQDLALSFPVFPPHYDANFKYLHCRGSSDHRVPGSTYCRRKYHARFPKCGIEIETDSTLGNSVAALDQTTGRNEADKGYDGIVMARP